MSAENKSLVRFTIEEVFNRKKPELIGSVYAADCMGSTPECLIHSRDGFRSLYERLATAFPDFQIDFEYMVAEDDRVVLPYVFRGTNDGPLGILPPTGQLMRVPGIAICRIADSWIRHQVLVWDNCEAWRQLRHPKGANLNPNPKATKAGL